MGPAVLVMALALGLRYATPIAVGVIAGVVMIIYGLPLAQIDDWLVDEFFPSEAGGVTAVVSLQIGLCLLAITVAMFSKGSIATNLSMVRPRLSITLWMALIAGTLVLCNLVIGIVFVIQGIAESRVLTIFTRSVGEWSTAWYVVLMTVSLFAAFSEEVLFRGYVQRRLQHACGVPLAILIASLGFGMMHSGATGVLVAMVTGMWLGVVAWYASSVWPAVVCHGVFNLYAGVWGRYFGHYDGPSIAIMASTGGS